MARTNQSARRSLGGRAIIVTGLRHRNEPARSPRPSATRDRLSSLTAGPPPPVAKVQRTRGITRVVLSSSNALDDHLPHASPASSTLHQDSAAESSDDADARSDEDVSTASLTTFKLTYRF
jgi:hypothetical protein